MRLHQLVPQIADVVVHNEECGQTVVLTPIGAVFDNEWTDDLTNMTVCFGMLITSDKWRFATKEEIDALRRDDGARILEVNFTKPVKKKAALKVLRGGKGENTFTQVGDTKLYDTDNIQ